MARLNQVVNSFPIEYSIQMNEAFTLNPTITGSVTPGAGNKFTVTGDSGDPSWAPTVNPPGGAGSWFFPNVNNARGAGISSTSALTQTWADGDFSLGFWLMSTELPTGGYFGPRVVFRITSSGFDFQIAYILNSGVWGLARSIDGGATWGTFTPPNLIQPNTWGYVQIVRNGATGSASFVYNVTLVNTVTAGTSGGTGGAISFGSTNSLDSTHSFYVSNFYILPTGTPVGNSIGTAGATAPATIRFYNGSSWQNASGQKVWNGTAWVDWNSNRRLNNIWTPLL